MKTLIQFPRVKTYDVRAHGVSPAFVEEAGFVQKRILIVDDNPGMLKLMRLFVNSDPDFQVCGEAFDGLDAVEKALDLKPDLIILDFQMPHLNDYKVGDRIKVRLTGGRVVDAEIKAIIEASEGKRLQVSFGEETARIYPWQVVEKSR